ncbi:MAG: ribosome biogenesis GTP-binding protein, partial [Synergistales bacterium]|nr:ribosome biogenesis GTP-binding protein [Synergistales bacterium]
MGRTVWFPGHMARGSRKLLELVRDLDLFLEVRDARAPLLTDSPFVESLRSARPVWQVLTRRDLADESVTSRLIDWF